MQRQQIHGNISYRREDKRATQAIGVPATHVRNRYNSTETHEYSKSTTTIRSEHHLPDEEVRGPVYEQAIHQ